MWFEQLMGFGEESPENVRNNLLVDGNTFTSKANGQKYTFGELTIPTLESLKQDSPSVEDYKSSIQVREIVADVQDLHCQPENKNALFQAASQFNLLEMVSPSITPEQGIDQYEYDYTQGPACAIACGAGTIYRNYLVKLGEQIGQTAEKQIDCLDLMGQALNNDALGLWKMVNGYALVSQEGLLTINKKIAGLTHTEREKLKGTLKTGIQWNTEVTLAKTPHTVSQIYCAALPLAYSQIEPIYWEYFARIILEATYESTLYAALINLERNKSNKVYLTLVGGGAFGNETYWILESIQHAIRKFKNTPLDIKIVSYGTSNRAVIDCIHQI